MSLHKHKHIETLKKTIAKTSKLNTTQKSDSIKRIEEWIAEDRAFGILQSELIKISIFFEEIFAEMGIE